MGRPVLGEHTKLEIIIEESYEFKVLSTPSVPVFLPPWLGTLLLGLHSTGRHMLMVLEQSEAVHAITHKTGTGTPNAAGCFKTWPCSHSEFHTLVLLSGLECAPSGP